VSPSRYKAGGISTSSQNGFKVGSVAAEQLALGDSVQSSSNVQLPAAEQNPVKKPSQPTGQSFGPKVNVGLVAGTSIPDGQTVATVCPGQSGGGGGKHLSSILVQSGAAQSAVNVPGQAAGHGTGKSSVKSGSPPGKFTVPQLGSLVNVTVFGSHVIGHRQLSILLSLAFIPIHRTLVVLAVIS